MHLVCRACVIPSFLIGCSLRSIAAARRYRGFPWGADDYLDLAAAAPWLWWAAMDWCVEPEMRIPRESGH